MITYILKRILIKFLIFLIFVVFLFFFTCGFPYCKKLPFTEDELKWTEPYTIGDTILFIGTQRKSIDTLIIKDKEIFNPSNTLIFDTEGCKWWNGDHEYNAIAGTNIFLLHNGFKYVGVFTIEKVCHRKPLMMGTYFMQRLADSIYIREIRDNEVVDFAEIEDLIIRDSDFSKEIKTGNIPLHEIYWNRDKGLTGYKIGDEVYVLKENTND